MRRLAVLAVLAAPPLLLLFEALRRFGDGLAEDFERNADRSFTERDLNGYIGGHL